MKRQYRRRREIIVGGAERDMKGVSCLMPKGAFYAFPNISQLRYPSGVCHASSEGRSTWWSSRHRLRGAARALVRLAYATSEDNIREG